MKKKTDVNAGIATGQKYVSLLSDEELSLKVAKLCGWRQIDAYNWEHRDFEGEYVDESDIPDYAADLDAMNDAETWLRPHISTPLLANVPRLS